MKYIASLIVIIAIAQFIGNTFADKVESGAATIIKELRHEK